jgi:hypothetical protein
MTKAILPLSEPVPIHPEYLEDFWRFVCERQNIYHRRLVEGANPPWTTDAVLREYFFTNVYRELDKGTKFWTEEIVPYCDSYRDLVWNLFVYRYFNAIPTYRALVDEYYDKSSSKVLRQKNEWDHKQVARFLTRRDLAGKQVFTSAFTVTGVRFGGYPDKIRNVCFLMEKLQQQVPRVVGSLARADNLSNVFGIFHGLDGMGPFLAYELAIDINYPQTIVKFSEDDFVNPGPGCMAGLKYIFGHRTKMGYYELIHFFRWRQERFFRMYGLWDTWRSVYPGYDLSLRSIEHSLCEFSKYARTKYQITANGTPSRNATRRYRPPVHQDQMRLAI